MLYHLFESQRAILAPFAELAQASSKLLTHPLSPLSMTMAAPRMAAAFQVLNRVAKDYVKPRFEITEVHAAGRDVAVFEKLALEKPFCRLLHFQRLSEDVQTLQALKTQPRVLIVAPLSGHHSTLLRDTVRTMLRDHDVYITDWVDARMVPLDSGPFSLDDYVHYIQEFIRFLGADQIHVMSVCQPTVPVLAAVSLMASSGEATPRSMIMMGGPIDARHTPTAVNDLAVGKSIEWFENNVIHSVPQNFPGAGRRVYPGFLQHTGFVAMNPNRHLTSHYDYFKDLVRGDESSAESHRKFYDEYNAVLDLPAEFYLDTIRVVFQDFDLVNKRWKVAGQLVRPQDITRTALLTVEGELDDIAGPGQTHAAHDLCEGMAAKNKQRYDVMGAGHYGIFSGRRWREHVYPVITDFIAGLQPKAAPAATVAPATEAAPKAAAKPVVKAAPAPVTAAAAAALAPAKAVVKKAPTIAAPKVTAPKAAAPKIAAPKSAVVKPAEAKVAPKAAPAPALTPAEPKAVAQPVVPPAAQTVAKAAPATVAPAPAQAAAPVDLVSAAQAAEPVAVKPQVAQPVAAQTAAKPSAAPKKPA
ncbi:polyhydroxyalkanoate depolymerase [Amphibiibacter pelophylacis]|uniref:Polyhydroxyalkanoate depolymerase n=1 Tax=Amphibiibacter pelophylacis TaxID=1799477 RepID=A0ACC6NZW7_9BURK